MREREGGGSIKTVVYLDVLLLVNFVVAYFLLLAAGALGGQRAGAGRMLAGSALAALSALVLFAPEMPYPGQLAYKLVTACLITAAAFGWHGPRRFFTVVSWYMALNLALAGFAVLAVQRTGTQRIQTGNLAVYLRVSPLLLLMLAAVCCLCVELVLRLGTPPSGAAASGFELELSGTTVRLRGVLDTGCHLKDPMTCLPVLLVSYPDAASRLPAEAARFLEQWFDGVRDAPPPEGLRLRLIPCSTAAEQSLLPGFAVEEIRLITVNGVLGLGRSAVAFAPRSFGSEEYEALYGPDFL